METKEFLKKVFGVLTGNVDWALDCTMPTFRYGERLNECVLECGTDSDTFYALDTYAQCPRAYMIKYLAKKPLSIPFYAKVDEAVRETVAEFAKGRITREGMVRDFESRYDKFVDGPYPIHQNEKDWKNDWKKQILPFFVNYEPLWERQGWHMVDAYCPVSVNLTGRMYKCVLDLVLKNDAGEYAIVVHYSGSGIRRNKRDGVIVDDGEGAGVLPRLLRKAYFCGMALESSCVEARGRISSLFLNLYKPKSHEPFALEYRWNKQEQDETNAWVQSMSELILRSEATKKWPCLVPCRMDKKGMITADDNFCHERCPHCISCRWAGMHPEDVKEYSDVVKVERIPQKYLGVGLKLRDDLDRDADVFKCKDMVTLDSGKVVKVTTVGKVLEHLGVKTIGDLDGKSIDDLFNTPGCGVTKLDALIALFFEMI